MSQNFHQRFNIQIDLEEAKNRFVSRVRNDIFGWLMEDSRLVLSHNRGDLERFVCSKLGIEYQKGYSLRRLIGRDFHVHLRAIEALYLHEPIKESLNNLVLRTLRDSEVDLGIRWNNGGFIRSGAPILDEKLVNEVLGTLDSERKESVLMPFRKGLDHFLHSIKKPELLADTITDMYEALEALAKIVVGKDRDLSAIQEQFISKLKISSKCKPILSGYISLANDFRHAPKIGKTKQNPSPHEVEFFVYLTGALIRLSLSEIS